MNIMNISLLFLVFVFFRMDSVPQSVKDRIITTPGLMGGRSTIRGLRFTVNDLLELLADGLGEAGILKQHPLLEKEDISAALLYVSQIKKS